MLSSPRPMSPSFLLVLTLSVTALKADEGPIRGPVEGARSPLARPRGPSRFGASAVAGREAVPEPVDLQEAFEKLTDTLSDATGRRTRELFLRLPPADRVRAYHQLKQAREVSSRLARQASSEALVTFVSAMAGAALAIRLPLRLIGASRLGGGTLAVPFRIGVVSAAIGAGLLARAIARSWAGESFHEALGRLEAQERLPVPAAPRAVPPASRLAPQRRIEAPATLQDDPFEGLHHSP